MTPGAAGLGTNGEEESVFQGRGSTLGLPLVFHDTYMPNRGIERVTVPVTCTETERERGNESDVQDTCLSPAASELVLNVRIWWL